MTNIYMTNSLTKKKELFQPLAPDGKTVGIYACGVTVYDDCHIGHAMQAIFWDTIRRYLTYAGFRVTYVRNYTDVDDKIIARAKEQGISPALLTERMIASSIKDMAALGIDPADFEPRVSEMIPEIVAMIEALIKNGSAYATQSGDVYYRVRSKSDYGKLSGRKVDDLRTGTRGLVAGDKEDDLDFALWKTDDVPDASWPSPWGVGRPGWHIECSAMSKKILGSSFDIHGGGRDLIFPHHENEIAQSEAANQAPYAKIWAHSGLLMIDHQKMSKSLGNHITIQAFLKTYPAEVLRLGILQHHYTSNIDFAKGSFMACHRRLLYYYETMSLLDELSVGVQVPAATLDQHQLLQDFQSAMSDDFNTAAAIAAVNKALKGARELAIGKRTPEKALQAGTLAAAVRRLGQVLGLFIGEPAATIKELKLKLLPELKVTEAEIETAIVQRRMERDKKDFAAADAVRDRLAAKGIELRDGPTGTTWSIKVNPDE